MTGEMSGQRAIEPIGDGAQAGPVREVSGAARPHSWVTSTSYTAPSSVRERLSRRRDQISIFDALVAFGVLAVFDLVGILVVSGWQSVRCGGYCGMRTQLHLMRIAALLSVTGVVLPPIVLALYLRRVRLLVAVAQALLCLGILFNVASTQHRLVPRINGTATCWNPLYSNADCPWGSKS